MNRTMRIVLALAAVAALGGVRQARATLQTGSIAFEAYAAPTDGRPEPVRQLTFISCGGATRRSRRKPKKPKLSQTWTASSTALKFPKNSKPG